MRPSLSCCCCCWYCCCCCPASLVLLLLLLLQRKGRVGPRGDPKERHLGALGNRNSYILQQLNAKSSKRCCSSSNNHSNSSRKIPLGAPPSLLGGPPERVGLLYSVCPGLPEGSGRPQAFFLCFLKITFTNKEKSDETNEGKDPIPYRCRDCTSNSSSSNSSSSNSSSSNSSSSRL